MRKKVQLLQVPIFVLSFDDTGEEIRKQDIEETVSSTNENKEQAKLPAGLSLLEVKKVLEESEKGEPQTEEDKSTSKGTDCFRWLMSKRGDTNNCGIEAN
jgi:hypothetical protein